MRQGLFLHRTYFFGTVPLLFLWSCGSGDSDASPVEPAGGASSGDSGASAGARRRAEARRNRAVVLTMARSAALRPTEGVGREVPLRSRGEATELGGG